MYNYLSCGVDYVEKLWDGSTIKSELFLLKMKIKNLIYIQFTLIFWATLTLVERRVMSIRIIQFLLQLQCTCCWYRHEVNKEITHSYNNHTHSFKDSIHFSSKILPVQMMDSSITKYCIIILTDWAKYHFHQENWSWNGERRDSVLTAYFYFIHNIVQE